MNRKTLRYYYWVILEFFRKHFKLIIVSFLLSFISLISVISLSPYIDTAITNKKISIGMAGKYDFNSVPDEITSKISNGLVFANDKGQILPILTSGWEVKNSGKEYVFHFKNDLLWNDGKKFTAKDINYQFKDVKEKIIDESTINFTLDKPLPIFPTFLTKPLIRYPLIGVAGLYKVTNIKTANGTINELTLDPNKKDLPLITYKFYDDETDLITAYKKGEITQMNVSKKSIADTFTNWKNTVISKTVDYSRLMTLFINSNNSFLKQKDVKSALTMSIDPESFKDSGDMADGPIPPISWAHNPNLKSPIFSIDSASKIIKKSQESTKSASLNLVTYYDYYDIGDEIASSLRQIGLSVNLNVISYDKPNSFDFLLAFWKVPSDPDQYYFWHSTQQQGNIGNYSNVKIDKLLEDGRNTLNVSERTTIYYDFQKNIVDDPPAVFLYYPYIYTIKRK